MPPALNFNHSGDSIGHWLGGIISILVRYFSLAYLFFLLYKMIIHEDDDFRTAV
jgi:hypothetical protein